MHEPRLTRCASDDCVWWTDEALSSRAEITVAFSERTGGLSRMPYASLNLAAHVGDAPGRVDENRARLMSALGVLPLRERLVTAEQVHGTHVALVDDSDAGRGAYADAGRSPLEGTDGLLTLEREVPLMLLFADCVPVILVVPPPAGPAVAVIHAGWRGVRDRIAAVGVRAVAQAAGCDASAVVAYIGPHVCPADYEVGPDLVSQFDERFVTVSRAATRAVDLGAAVSASLVDAGVPMSAQCSLDACTAECTDRFFSYRAEGLTGRHAAFAVMIGRQG